MRPLSDGSLGGPVDFGRSDRYRSLALVFGSSRRLCAVHRKRTCLAHVSSHAKTTDFADRTEGTIAGAIPILMPMIVMSSYVSAPNATSPQTTGIGTCPVPLVRPRRRGQPIRFLRRLIAFIFRRCAGSRTEPVFRWRVNKWSKIMGAFLSGVK